MISTDIIAVTVTDTAASGQTGVAVTNIIIKPSLAITTVNVQIGVLIRNLFIVGLTPKEINSTTVMQGKDGLQAVLFHLPLNASIRSMRRPCSDCSRNIVFTSSFISPIAPESAL